ncbi:MAG: UvrD-helicase domain-containing protein [Turicibacter sp.]
MIEWSPSEGIEATSELMDIIKCDQSVAVLAGAGAGKTELLAQKASYLFFTNKCTWPRRILSLTFKVEAQINIKERINKRCGHKASRFDSFTFHAFSKSIVDRFRNVLPENERPENNYDIVFKSSEANGRNKILMDKLLAMSIRILKERDDIRKIFQLTYSHVFVDEFQDTTDEQYELIKLLFQCNETKLLTVGDIYQSIMIWAGAKKNIFQDFLSDFSANSMFLVKNHRASHEIQGILSIILSCIKDSNATIVPIDNQSQNCSIHIFNDEYHEADFIVKHIKDTISSGVSAGDICILTKQHSTQYTAILSAQLTKEGINNLDMTNLQDALKEPLGRIFSLFLKAVTFPEPKVMTDLYEMNLNLNNVEFGDNKEGELTSKIISFITSKKNGLPEKITTDNLIEVIRESINFLGIKKIMARWKQYKSTSYYNSIWSVLETHLRNVMNQATSLKSAVNNFNAEESIHIMNIHKCKGLEYHSVYFLGLEDQAFWNYEKEPFENNCAIYVALSRAKNAITITYSKYRSHRPVNSYGDHRHSTCKLMRPIFGILNNQCRFIAVNHTNH